MHITSLGLMVRAVYCLVFISLCKIVARIQHNLKTENGIRAFYLIYLLRKYFHWLISRSRYSLNNFVL